MTKFQNNHFVLGLIWVAVMGVAYLYFDSRAKPPASVTVAGEARIPRARDGHFYVSGAINGVSVEFLVDTGATSVSLSRVTADRVGLPEGSPAQFMTAAGSVQGAYVDDVTVSAGGIQVSNLNVSITNGGGPEALLGQNFLRYMDVEIRDDVMVLRAQRNGLGT